METRENRDFVVKKKQYSKPEFKRYGSFSERTKGLGKHGPQADNISYYHGVPS